MTTTENIFENCPAILAGVPSGVSPRYDFIDTRRVVELIVAEGWYVAAVKANRYYASTFHAVRLRRKIPLRIDADSECEIVVANAHNGRTALKLYAGIFRVVCENGLVLGNLLFAPTTIRHRQVSRENLTDIVANFPRRIDPIARYVAELKSFTPNGPQRQKFLTSALALAPKRIGKFFDAESLGQPTRAADSGADLWTLLNVVQEKILRNVASARSALILNQALFENAYALASKKLARTG